MALTPQNYADPVVTINTSMGNIVLELFPGQAPITVGNFLTYAYSGFYSGTIFHRVVAGFVDQGGGFTTQYQQKPTLPPIPLETPNGLSNLAGTIAMARTNDPNSATSQFYINAVNNPFLDYSSASSPGYAVFGDVIQGMNVVSAINNVAVDANSVPLTQIVISSVSTSVYYPGTRADYTISMVGGQLAVTPLSDAPSEPNLPAASILAKTNTLQFADLAVTPASETVSLVVTAFNGGTLAAPTDIFDSSANVAQALGTIETIAAAGKLTSIGFTDSGTPILTLNSAQFTADATALNHISGNYAISDSAADILSNLSTVETLATAGKLSGITLTDTGTPTLTVTAAQFAADAAALNDITSAHAVTVQMTGNAAGHNFTGENWAGATALQFADQTVFVAAAPGGANSVTTSNVTELYSAVLAREPDVSGLAFYQNYLKSNPTTSLQTFAEFFLNSTEYTSAHSYAQTTAGETQFITDSYQNLLHRTPSADEVNFYLTNVLEKPGTQLENHALMLVYFSASTEFLGDVQITATNPASAQHWLLLA